MRNSEYKINFEIFILDCELFNWTFAIIDDIGDIDYIYDKKFNKK